MFEGIYTLLNVKRVLAGVNSIDRIGEIVADCAVERVLMITDQGVWQAGLVEKPLNLLKAAKVTVEVINTVPPEPEINHINDIYRSAKELNCQMVIAIGGGSAMDVAKIIAVLMTNTNTVEELLGTDKVGNRGLPTVMVPTTAGTGAEVTPNAIVLVPEQELKVGVVSSKLIPDYVILDPLMTVKLPPAITASTGMDALTHAIECYISLKANPFSDTFALRAVQLISGSIREAYRQGESLRARHDMLIGAYYGGMCIATSGTAAVHALAYPLGSKYRIPHGLSNAMLLPYVMEFNQDAVEGKFRDIAVAMGLPVQHLTPQAAAEKMVENLYSLLQELEIKSALKGKRISEADLDQMVEAASQVTRLLDNNPKVVTRQDMRAIYSRLL